MFCNCFLLSRVVNLSVPRFRGFLPSVKRRKEQKRNFHAGKRDFAKSRPVCCPWETEFTSPKDDVVQRMALLDKLAFLW